MDSTTKIFIAVPLVMTYSASLPFGSVWTALSPHTHVPIAALRILGAGLQHITIQGLHKLLDCLCETHKSHC